ncbi:MAG: efflux RND transporter periplasmic adaptor subunit [Thermodesulfobacteriota bacterium]
MDQETGRIKKELQIRPGRRKLKLLLVAALVLAILAGGAAVFRSREKNLERPRFQTQEAVRGDLTVTVTATGSLNPVNQVEVGTEVSGTVAFVDVDYNDPVKEGQILARLDLTKLSAQAEQARAALGSAKAVLAQQQASLVDKRAQLTRMQEANRLSGGKIPSRLDLEQAQAAVDQAVAGVAGAKASISQAEANLAVDETNLTKAVIRSPINGVVLKRSVEPGQTVAASLQAPVLFTLADDLSRMTLTVDVDEADVGKVRAGQEATFSVDAYPDRTFSARVAQVRLAPTTQGGVVTYQTLLSVENPDLLLMPGMTATADIVVEKIADAVLIPNAALRYHPPEAPEKPKNVSLVSRLFARRPPSWGPQQNGRNEKDKGLKVYADKNGRSVPVGITIGPSDGRMTQVLSGDIKPGMRLIVDVERTPS